MSTAPTTLGSSAARMTRHRNRRRQGTRCVTVDVNQSEVDALVVRGYLSEEERDNGAAIKKAIEGVLSDLVFELQSETAERSRSRV
jgi:hypothetical protein